jgi:hypothetical protein
MFQLSSSPEEKFPILIGSLSNPKVNKCCKITERLMSRDKCKTFCLMVKDDFITPEETFSRQKLREKLSVIRFLLNLLLQVKMAFFNVLDLNQRKLLLFRFKLEEQMNL